MHPRVSTQKKYPKIVLHSPFNKQNPLSLYEAGLLPSLRRAPSMQSGVIWSTLRDEWDDLLSLFVLSLGIFLWVLRPNNWHDLIHGESAQEFSGRAQEKNAGKAPTNRTPPPRASGRARTWSDPTGGARRAGLASGDDVRQLWTQKGNNSRAGRERADVHLSPAFSDQFRRERVEEV